MRFIAEGLCPTLVKYGLSPPNIFKIFPELAALEVRSQGTGHSWTSSPRAHIFFFFGTSPKTTWSLWPKSSKAEYLEGGGSESGLQPSAHRQLETGAFPLGASASLWFQLQGHKCFRGTGTAGAWGAIPFPRLWANSVVWQDAPARKARSAAWTDLLAACFGVGLAFHLRAGCLSS